MKSEFSAENLFFLLSVLRIKSLFRVADAIFVEEAKDIYSVFISEDSQLMVNLSAETRDRKCFPRCCC